MVHTNQKNYQKYLTTNDLCESWGVICTTVGFQEVQPHGRYPVQQHPSEYIFTKEKGRILSEYQLLYITEGKGFFIRNDGKKIDVCAGCVIMLTPGVWHSYYPDPEVGWKEYWVGFTGRNMDLILASEFFSKDQPVHRFGLHTKFMDYFEEIIKISEKERSGFQQYMSGILMHMLGCLYYRSKNAEYADNPLVDKINKARSLMQERLSDNISPKDVADNLGIGYTWFRRTFKEYVGISPGQYQLQLKHLKAKELLMNDKLPISEISFELGFESISQFSNFFKKHSGISASEYRKGILV